MAKKRRRAVIRERLLIGTYTCRVGLCGRDGTVGVDLPGMTYDYRRAEEGGVGELDTWTRVYFCEAHAQEHVRTFPG